MNRKILSLALAIMMILSVAVALPVSAASAPRVVADLTNLSSNNDGVNNASSVYTTYRTTGVTATSVPEGADWVDKTNPRAFYKYTSNLPETYSRLTITVPVAGYYDVSIAYGSDVNAYVGFRANNSALVQEKVTATGPKSSKAESEASRRVVNIQKFSRKIYLTEGQQYTYMHVKPEANSYAGDFSVYAYSLLLEYSADQTTIEDTIMAGDFNNKTASGVSAAKDGSVIPENNFGWVPAGLSYCASNSYNSTWTVYIPADGYYELSVATRKESSTALTANIKYDDTTIASGVALTGTGSTATLPKVVTTNRFVAMKGLHTFTLNYTNSATGWISGLKLSWSQNQIPDPVDVSFAACNSYKGSTSSTVFNGQKPPADCNIEWVKSTSKALYPRWTSGFHKNVTMPKAGYYDVLIATSASNDATGYVYGGGQITSAIIPATGSVGTVAVANLGKIYLGKGTQDLNIEIDCADVSYSESTLTHVYDLRLQYSAEQEEIPSDIIISADAPSQFKRPSAVGGDGTINVHTQALDESANDCDWATTGATLVEESQWYEYDVNVPEAGYYDLYTAACTKNNDANSYMSVIINGVAYVESAAQTDTNNARFNSADQTYFGSVYLKAGINTVRVEGDADSSEYYLFNIKLSKTEAPANNKITLLDHSNNVIESNTFAEGEKVFAEIKATADAKLFIVSYTDLGDGLMKMDACQEATSVIEDGDIIVIRTPLVTTGKIVKVFAWAEGTFAPVDIIVPTVE